jgi:hypothetical protein
LQKVADADSYWAALEGEDYARAAWDKIGAFYEFTRASPHFKRIGMAYRAIFGVGGNDGTTWELQRSGSQGQIIRLESGHYRNLAEHRVTIATQQKPAWQPVANNSDYTSLAQSKSVSNLMDYYWRDKRVSRHLRTALKNIQWGGEGFVFKLWDTETGEDVAVEDVPEGAPEGAQPETLKQGDLKFTTPTIYDVVRDPYASSWDTTNWRGVREFVSKWDLAAQFPDQADDILKMDSSPFDLSHTRVAGASKSDEVAVFHMLHDRSPALPGGKYALIAGPGLVLIPPMDMPYRSNPLTRIVEDEIEGMPFGYTAMWDVLGLKQAYDKLTAAILTNFIAHAINKIVSVKGAGTSYKQLTEALGLLEVNSMDQMPQALDLSEMNPQVIAFRQELAGEMQQLANLNDVARGVTTENIKSGAHAALFDAIALRGANALQESYFAASEDIGTFVLHALTDFGGDFERTGRIIGETNRPLLFTFKPEELGVFERVTIETVDGALKTASQREAAADKLLDKGALGGPGDPTVAQRYITLIKTGEVDQLTEAPQMQFLRIKRDKEMLAKGIGPVPMAPSMDPLTGMPSEQPMVEPGKEYLVIIETDPHWLDIPEYLSVLSSPEARENPAVTKAVTEAVTIKLEMWRNMDPDLIALLGGPPPPSMTGAMPPGGPSGTPPPAPGETSSTAPKSPTGANLPNLPSNPQSGEPYDPTEGAVA